MQKDEWLSIHLNKIDMPVLTYHFLLFQKQ